MDKWSTINISMNIFSTVFELFREIEHPDIFKATIPYDIIKIEADVLHSDLLENLPEEFFENRYYLLQNNKLRATIDTGFHKSEGLVNFNILVSIKF